MAGHAAGWVQKLECHTFLELILSFLLLRWQVVKLCYDHDLLSEDAILDWAHEKEHAAADERRFVNLCADLLAWLEDADEESSEDSDA